MIAALARRLLRAAAPAAARGLASAPPPPGGGRVAVALSGGVDSAVAALLLKRAGRDVVGIFMRNWDEAEERGGGGGGAPRVCSAERDLADAARVCRQLGVPLHEADFVSRYWTRVFAGFLDECGRGLTPNPDLACNRHIKFDALLDFAAALGAATVATGHYARLRPGPGGGPPQLLRGVDRSKDQSYFLASVRPEALARAEFPLGGMLKAEVRALAAAAGLAPAAKRSSAGICFVGRRRFGDFLAQYVPPAPGRFVDVDTGADAGRCPNVLALTYGQRAGVGGAAARAYVAGKDVRARVVYVAAGGGHPALAARSAALRPPAWLSAPHAARLAAEGRLECQYKARYGQPPAACTVELPAAAGAAAFRPSALTVLHARDAALPRGHLIVRFHRPAAAVTPQQACVLYDGDLVLGAADIALPGETLAEEAGLRVAPPAAAAAAEA